MPPSAAREHLARFAHAAQAVAAEPAEVAAQRGAGADEGVGDEEVAAEFLAQRLETAGLVDGGADGGEVEPVGGADVAVGDLALVERDVEGEGGMAGRRFGFVETVDAGEE